MKRQKPNWTKAGLPVFALLCIGLAGYWAVLLRQSFAEQYSDDGEQLAGFVRWLSGYVMVAAGLVFAAWLNFRWPYRLLAGPQRRWYYRTWLLLLCWGLFELLQWRTMHDIELVEENLLVAALFSLVIAGLTLVFDTVKARRERAELLQQKTAAELAGLRAQLNPHFLFNALNTLYSEAVQQGQDKLSQHIAGLSGILRFSLQQARQDTVPISEEIEFLQRYISLQQARLPENPNRKLDIQLHWDGQPVRIAPLLLIPFVENAFQYGLHPARPCFITIHLDAGSHRVRLRVENSIIRPQSHRGAGLGIANTQERLERLYPHRHNLTVKEEGEVFKVELEVVREE